MEFFVIQGNTTKIFLSRVCIHCLWQWPKIVSTLIDYGLSKEDAEAYASFAIADKEDKWDYENACSIAEGFLSNKQWEALDGERLLCTNEVGGWIILVHLLDNP